MVKYQWGEKEHVALLPVLKITSLTIADENARQVVARKKLGSTTSSSRRGELELSAPNLYVILRTCYTSMGRQKAHSRVLVFASVHQAAVVLVFLWPS